MRDARALAGAQLAGDGIEIGACHEPLAVDRTRARVTYVDRLTPDQIRARFPELAEANIVAPDVVCDVATEKLRPFAAGSLDFVIASHVLEHVPDPLGLLVDAHRVLREGGVFYLGLPDKDYTFDSDRAVTPLEHLLDDLARGTTHYDRFHFEDHLARAARMPVPTEPAAYAAAFQRELDRSFHVHVWTWRDVVAFVRHMLARAPFELVDLYLPNGFKNEIILLLRKRALSPAMARLRFDVRFARLRVRELAVEARWKLTHPNDLAYYLRSRLRT